LHQYPTMIRKKTALLFLLLANIVLLVHAVAPHHHHHNQVCIDNVHCQDDWATPRHSTSEHNHQPDGSEETDNCTLKQAVVIPTNSYKQTLKALYFDENPGPHTGGQAILGDHLLKTFQPTMVTGIINSRIILPYSNILSSSSGLRAPPTV